MDHIPPLSRGGDHSTQHFKEELEWMFKVCSLKPIGLSVEFKMTS